MQILACSGFHAPTLTFGFLQALGWQDIKVPPQHLSPLDGFGIARYLANSGDRRPTLFVGFSAGVIGAATAATLWQQQGNTVAALVAIDGWGVPLISAGFPVYRLSHDRFTHLTSGWGEPWQERFYCDPPVEHLELWRSPDRAWGWYRLRPGWHVRASAATYLQQIVNRHVPNP